MANSSRTTTFREWPPLPKAELERRAQGAKRLKERFGSIPFYAEAAKKDGDEERYWLRFYDSRVKS